LYNIILFDLDGTLTDPKEGITRCVQYALEKVGVIEPDRDKLIPFIGPPLMASFQEMYGLTEEEARRGVGYYRERFVNVGMFENGVYPKIPAMLQTLQDLGKELVVATSKPTVYSVQILDHFDLSRYFSKVIGSNLDGSRVEKGEVIEFALSEIGRYDKSRVVMVGDRKHDVIGAGKNGIDSVAVTWGYGDREELSQARPTYSVFTVDQLTELLSKE
jgi:phosphoglycolate phosphatase